MYKVIANTASSNTQTYKAMIDTANLISNDDIHYHIKAFHVEKIASYRGEENLRPEFITFVLEPDEEDVHKVYESNLSPRDVEEYEDQDYQLEARVSSGIGEYDIAEIQIVDILDGRAGTLERKEIRNLPFEYTSRDVKEWLNYAALRACNFCDKYIL